MLSPISLTLPDVIKLGSSFFTLLTESSTSSLMWSIPITFPLGPTCKKYKQKKQAVVEFKDITTWRKLTQADCFYPSWGAHHSCEANGQNSTAGPHVQGFGPLVQLVVQKLESVGMLGEDEDIRNWIITYNIRNHTQQKLVFYILTSKMYFKHILPCVEHWWWLETLQIQKETQIGLVQHWRATVNDRVLLSARAHVPMDWGESMYGLHLEKWARSVASMTS